MAHGASVILRDEQGQAIGTPTNPVAVAFPPGSGGAMPVSLDEASIPSIGSTADPATKTSVIGLLKALLLRLPSVVGPRAAAESLSVTFAPDGRAGAAGVPTQGGGAITTASQKQAVIPANAARRYLLFQNQSVADMYLNLAGGDATVGQPSMLVESGASFVMEGAFVSTGAVSVACATAGAAYAWVQA